MKTLITKAWTDRRFVESKKPAPEKPARRGRGPAVVSYSVMTRTQPTYAVVTHTGRGHGQDVIISSSNSPLRLMTCHAQLISSRYPLPPISQLAPPATANVSLAISGYLGRCSISLIYNSILCTMSL
ncbi:hypothetical protein J6590_060269 [Homalodisca vitripennis]|nr:hypothetical protein J6590_060269 [Homalodisca vitripennis]